ncbi:MAG: NAD(P)H-dependent oxidoreductase [Pseudomonadota bacterium]|nr:NAD(P)H-dependent oxidoreductase [Pseudomonadota bacterium]
MRVLAFAASNSSQSINRQLAEYAATLVPHAEIEHLDIHDYEMPIYRMDREEESGIPQLAHDFLARIGTVDAVIISFAEHNGNYTAAFKNLFDWCSRIGRDVWQNKKMALLSTSPGGRGGMSVLEIAAAAAPRFGGDVVGHLSIPSFGENFDTGAGRLANAELDAQLKALIEKLAEGFI